MLPFSIMSTYGNIIPGIESLKKVASNDGSLFALTTTGDLYCRGVNSNGQLGTGDTVSVTSWFLTNTNVQDIWADLSSTLILKNDGTWWMTGLPRGAIAGGNTGGVWTNYSTSFSAVPSVKKLVLTTNNCYIIDNDNNLYAAGLNTDGQLGTGNTTSQSGLVLRSEVGKVIDIAATPSANNSTFYYINASNVLFGSGASDVGQLLQTTAQSTFKQLTTGALKIATGTRCFFCTKSDGLYVAGTQYQGQLGDGTNGSTVSSNSRSTLFKITAFSTAPDMVYSKNQRTIVYMPTSTYGTGPALTLSLGSTATLTTFTLIPAANLPAFSHTTGREWIMGSSNSWVIGTNGNLYGCGAYNSALSLIPDYTATQNMLVLLNLTLH